MIIGTREFNVLCTVDVGIEVQAFLVVADAASMSQRQRIAAAFAAFDAATDGNPHDFIAQQLASHSDIDRGMFSVDLGFAISIDRAVNVDGRERDQVLSLYAGYWDGDIVVGSGEYTGLEGYFNSRDIWFSQRGHRDFLEVVNPPLESPSEVVTNDPIGAVQKIIDGEMRGRDCEDFEKKIERIASLKNWPETKVIWLEHRVNLGCGAWTYIPYPKLMTRDVEYALWGHVTIPRNILHLVEREVMDCFWKSVVASTVIGIALANLPAALIAFRALFIACIQSKFTDSLACVEVGLTITKEVTHDWH